MKNNMQFTKGFTLIEAVVVITIIAIIGTVGAMIVLEGSRNYIKAANFSSRSQMGGYAVARLNREIRMAQSITLANPSSVRFVNLSGRTIVFDISGSNIRRQESGGTFRTLASNVSTFTLTYLDSNFATTAVLNDIRYISYVIAVTYPSGESISYRGLTNLRNIGP